MAVAVGRIVARGVWITWAIGDGLVMIAGVDEFVIDEQLDSMINKHTRPLKRTINLNW